MEPSPHNSSSPILDWIVAETKHPRAQGPRRPNSRPRRPTGPLERAPEQRPQQSFSGLEHTGLVLRFPNPLPTDIESAASDKECWDGFRQLIENQNSGPYVEIEWPAGYDSQLDVLVDNVMDQGFQLVNVTHNGEGEACFLAKFRIVDMALSDQDLFLKRRSDDMIWPLSASGDVFLGRSHGSDIRLQSMEASARHCRIYFCRRAVAIVDLVSEAGTFLNNQPLRRAIVDSFGLISLGRKETGQYLELELQVPTGEPATLRVISGTNRGRCVPLLRGITVIGRDPRCDQQIVAPYISRFHCRLSLLENVTLVEDLGSSNGTLLNGRRIACDRILPGDQLELAAEHFDVVNSNILRGQFGVGASLRLEERDYSLNQPVCTIGSQPSCTIAVPGVGLSRQHARLVWEKNGQELRLYDLGGPGGTYVNGNSVSSAGLKHGDRLEFGSLVTFLSLEEGQGV